MRRSSTVGNFQKVQKDFDEIVSQLRATKIKLMFCSTLSSNKLENILKRRESKQSAIIKSRAEQAKSKDWMMYDNYYEHPSPWKRTKTIREDFSKSPFFFTGDERHSVMHREVHLLPRSYQVPQDKPVFTNPKKDCFIFPQIDHSNLTKTGSSMAKKGKDSWENLQKTKIEDRNREVNNKRNILMEKYKNQPRWCVNVKSRTMRFTPYQADTAVVQSQKSRYDSLKIYQTLSYNPSQSSISGNMMLEKPFYRNTKGEKLFCVEQGALI